MIRNRCYRALLRAALYIGENLHTIVRVGERPAASTDQRIYPNTFSIVNVALLVVLRRKMAHVLRQNAGTARYEEFRASRIEFSVAMRAEYCVNGRATNAEAVRGIRRRTEISPKSPFKTAQDNIFWRLCVFYIARFTILGNH